MAEGQGTKVGELYYDCTLEMGKMVRDSRVADQQINKLEASLTELSKAVQAHIAQTREEAAAMRSAGDAAKKQGADQKAAAEAAAAARRAAAEAARQQAEAEKAAAAEAKKRAAEEKAAQDAIAKAKRQATNKQRQLTPQITDITVGLATGQSPMTVLLQQGGQLKDVMGGVGPAVKAVGGYLAGLLTPLTAVGAAVAGLVVGFIKGRQEMDAIRSALALAGNQTGVTAGMVNSLARELGDLTNITRAQAAEALTVFVQAGVRGEGMLKKLAEAAIRLEQAGGPAVAETAKAFRDLQQNPLQAALKLNEATNFLTASIYKQILALQEQGKTTEAARIAQTAYADAVLGRSATITQNLGILEKSWKDIVGAAKSAWDAMLNVGRTATPEEAINGVRERIAAVQKQLEGGGYSSTGGGAATGRGIGIRQRQQLEGELAALQEQVKVYDRGQRAAAALADEEAKRYEQVQALAEFDKAGEKFLEKKARMEREIMQAREIGKRARLSEQQIEERIAAIRKSYADKPPEFDSAGYLAGLAVKAAEGLDKIDAEEEASLQRNDKLLQERKISRETALRAITLIEQAAARARQAIYEKENADDIARGQRDFEDQQALAKKKADAAKFVAGLNGQTSPQAKILEEEARDLETLKALHDQALIDRQQYEDGLVFIAEIAAEKRRRIKENEAAALRSVEMQVVSLAAQTADELYSVLEKAGQQRTALAKALFLASKGLAIAEIIVNTQVGAASALRLGAPGIPLAAAIESLGYARAAIVAGTAIAQVAGGRQYGGPVSSGSLYRVNETGRPEMFTGANGNQYMLPTQGGSVTAADKIGGGGVQVVVNNYAGADVQATASPDGRVIEIAVRQAKAEIAAEIASNSGQVYGALRGATNLQPRING